MTQNQAHPLASAKNFVQFPNDVYVPATIIAYNVADLPPSKFADTNDVVPSVRFLFASKVIDDNGEPVTVRKWTDWMRISYNEKAKLPKVFSGFPNLAVMLQDDAEGGQLWTTPMKLMCEANGDGRYSKIIRVKPGETNAGLEDIVYDVEFTPYKYVKAFGNLVNLRLAVIKADDGVHTFTPDDMIEPPTEQPAE